MQHYQRPQMQEDGHFVVSVHSEHEGISYLDNAQKKYSSWLHLAFTASCHRSNYLVSLRCQLEREDPLSTHCVTAK